MAPKKYLVHMQWSLNCSLYVKGKNVITETETIKLSYRFKIYTIPDFHF